MSHICTVSSVFLDYLIIGARQINDETFNNHSLQFVIWYLFEWDDFSMGTFEDEE